MNLFLSAEATGAMGSSTLIMIVLMFGARKRNRSNRCATL